MNNKIKFLIIIILITSGCNYNLKKDIDKLTKQICFEKQCFDVELAITEEKKSNGLMFRENLEQNSGMLFVYNKTEEHSFWMKNTLIPLDIIWINNDTSVYIYKNALPCETIKCQSIKPNVTSDYVLELNSGKTLEYNISLGNKIRII